MTRLPDPSGTGADRRQATPTHERLTSPEAVVADGELTPPAKLDLLTGWDEDRGTARPEGHGRVAGAADLGFPDPAPYSPEVQRAVVELYRRHRSDLPRPADGPWFAAAASGQRPSRKATDADPD